MKQADDYSFLNAVWADLLAEHTDALRAEREQLAPASPQVVEEKIQALIADGHVTEEEIKAWVYPMKGISFEKLCLLTSLQSEYSQVQGDYGVEIQVKPKSQSRLVRALTWTVVHLALLDLKGFTPQAMYTEWLDEPLLETIIRAEVFGFEPYHQCYWCGKIDFDAGKSHKRVRRYCHASDCANTTLSNPSQHLNCCQGKAGLARRNVKEKLNTYLKSGKSRAQQRTMASKCLRHYCAERLQANMSKKWDVLSEAGYKFWHFQATYQRWLEQNTVKG